jgi:hypothetical protein
VIIVDNEITDQLGGGQSLSEGLELILELNEAGHLETDEEVRVEGDPLSDLVGGDAWDTEVHGRANTEDS